MRPAHGFCAVVLLMAAGPASPAPEPETPLGGIVISFQADETPLRDLVADLSQKARRDIHVLGEADVKITAAAREIRFAQALRMVSSSAGLVGLWRRDELVLVPVEEFVGELPNKLAQGDREATALAAEILASLPNRYSDDPRRAIARVWQAAEKATRTLLADGEPQGAAEVLATLAKSDPDGLSPPLAREVIAACLRAGALGTAREALDAWSLPPPDRQRPDGQDLKVAWQVVVALHLLGEAELATDAQKAWRLRGTGWLDPLREQAILEDADTASVARALGALVADQATRGGEVRQFASEVAQKALSAAEHAAARDAYESCLGKGTRSPEESALGWSIAIAHGAEGARDEIVALAERWGLPKGDWPAGIQEAVELEALPLAALTAALAALAERCPPAEAATAAAPSFDEARQAAFALLGAWLDAGEAPSAHQLWQDWAAPALPDHEAVVLGLRLARAHLSAGASEPARRLATQLADPEAVPAAFEAMWDTGPPREALRVLRATIELADRTGEQAAQRRLTAFLAQALAAPRVLKVAARAHPSILGDPQWRRKTRGRLEAASQALSRQFNISLELVELTPWEGAHDDPFVAMEDLVNVQQESGADLALGFALTVVPPHLQHLLDEETSVVGVSWPPFRGRVLVRDLAIRGGGDSHLLIFDPRTGTLTPEAAAATLVHELGHAFGAVHSPDQESVMAFGLRGSLTTHFDDANATIVRAAKWVDFHLGPDSLDEPELAQIVAAYRQILRAYRSSEGLGEYLATVICARARLLCQEGQAARACGQVVAAMRALNDTGEARAELATQALAGLDETIGEALATAPDDPPMLAARGAILLATGGRDEGMDVLRRAVALDDSLVEAHLTLAMALEEAGDLPAALGHAQGALASAGADPGGEESPEAHYVLGRLLAATGDLEGAAEAWARALELAPDYVRARSNLALLECHTGPEPGHLRLPLVRTELGLVLEPTTWDLWNGSFEPGPAGPTLAASHLPSRRGGSPAPVELRLSTDPSLWQLWGSSAAIGIALEARKRSLWTAVEGEMQQEGIVAPEHVEDLHLTVPGAWTTARVYQTLRGQTTVRQVQVLLEGPEDRVFVRLSISGAEQDVATYQDDVQAVLSSLRRGPPA